MSASRALDRAGVDADAEEAAAAAAKEEVLRPMPSVIIAARSAISPGEHFPTDTPSEIK